MVRMWRNWNPYTLLMGMLSGAAALENSFTVPQVVKQSYHTTL